MLCDEGMGLSARPSAYEAAGDLRELFVYRCGANRSDVTFGPAGWVPAQGGPCARDVAAPPALFVHATRSGPSAADLVELEMWCTPHE
jgi:hypothetical protein